MLRTPKLGNPLRTALIVASLIHVSGVSGRSEDELPTGFKPDRYQKVWERNPFTLVAPVVAQAKVTVFDKLILLSWLKDGGTDVVFIQNTENNNVQRVTNQPNAEGWRLLAVHVDADPRKAEVVLSHGEEQGSVKFRVEAPATVQAPGAPGQPGAQNSGPSAVPQQLPGATGRFQMQSQQNSLQAVQQGGRMSVVPTQQGASPGQTDNTFKPPRASEIRRKRVTAPPVKEQLVNPQPPYQDPGNQPQGQ